MDEDDFPVAELDLTARRWQNFQANWLTQPRVRDRIRLCGWDAKVLPQLSAVTFRDVRDRLLPNWHHWMEQGYENLRQETVGARQAG